MKPKILLISLLFALTLTFSLPQPASARPLLQTISLQAQVTGPDAQGAYHVSGSFTASGLFPEGQLNIRNDVSVYAEFIGPGGRWPVFYDSYSIAAACYTKGDSCLPTADVEGDILGRVTVGGYSNIPQSDDGKSIPFDGDVTPPLGATEMRIVASLNHQWSGTWPAWHYAWDVHGPQAVTAPPPETATPTSAPTPTAPPTGLPTSTPSSATDTPSSTTDTPSPTHTVTPTPGPCSVTLSPSPAYVMPGESVEIAGTAVWADGQPIDNALLVIQYDTLDGSGYVSQAQTDAQGRFTFIYAAPPDVGGVTSVSVKVTVEGCPVSASVTIYFGPPPTATPPPTAAPPPTATPPPTVMPTPTSIPTPTPTPERDGDLTIHRIEVFQPVEGTLLAAHKRTAVRVFANWSVQGGAVQAKVDLHVNDRLFDRRGPVTIRNQASYSDAEIRAGHNSVDYFLPADWVQQGELKVRAVVDPDDAVAEVDETNNEEILPPITVYPSHRSSMMIVMLDNNVQPSTVDTWAPLARRFMLQTYPIPSFRVVRPYARLHAHENLLLGYLDALRVDMLRKFHNYANAKNPGNMAEFGVGLFYDAPYGSWLGMVKRGLSYGSYRNAPLVCKDYPLTLAHEIGHKYNNGVEEADSTRDGIPIPEGFRYDCLVDRLRYVDGSPAWINFMGDPHATGVQAWINADTYNQILRGRIGASSNRHRAVAAALTTAPRAPARNWRAFSQFEQVLLVAGGFGENGNVVLVPPLAIEGDTVESGPGGPYTAELQADDGTVLASVSFDIDTEIGEYDSPNPGMFSFEMPFPADAARLVLSDSSGVIYTLDRSPSPPTVSVEQPGGGSVTSETTASWTAADSDGDGLAYAVLYSPDGGTTWYPLTLDWPDPSLPIDGAYLPGGDNAIIRVLASDGLNTTPADSPPFSVPKHMPTVTILSPAPGAEPWTAGQPDTLAASADDVEDGWLSDSAYQWSSDRDGPLGQGSALHVALSEGTHTVTVLVTDADGQQGSASVTVEVRPAQPLGGLMDPMMWVFGLGGAVALLALVVAGVVILYGLTRRPEPALAAIDSQAAAIRQQVQTGYLHPSQVRPLTAIDRHGRRWSLDPLQGIWSLWNGFAWQPTRTPVGGPSSGTIIALAIGGLIVAFGCLALIVFVIVPGYLAF